MRSADTPETSTRFLRLRSPERILTAATGTFKRSASRRRSASLARSSTGGAVRRTFSAPCHSPSMASRLARACTRTEKTTAPSPSRMSITFAAYHSSAADARAEEGRAQPDLCGAFLDSRLKIVRHPHGQFRQEEFFAALRITGMEMNTQGLTQLAQLAEIRPGLLRVVEIRRDAHQAAQME